MSGTGTSAVSSEYWRDAADNPYVNPLATAVLALASSSFIFLNNWAPDSSQPVLAIALLGLGQAFVFWSAGEAPLRYRLVSVAAMLAVFVAALVPAAVSVTPASTGTAIALAAGGSLPVWALTLWRANIARKPSALGPDANPL